MTPKVQEFCRAIHGRYKYDYDRKVNTLVKNFSGVSSFDRDCVNTILNLLDNFLFDKDPGIVVRGYFSEEEMNFLANNLVSYVRDQNTNKWFEDK